MICSSQRTVLVAIPTPVGCAVFTSEKYLRKLQNLQGALQQENTKVIKQKQRSPCHETLPPRLAGRWTLHTVISAKSLATSQFFYIVQIMYLSALHYVAKDETHCSLPLNQEGRQALRKPLAAKKYWARSTQKQVRSFTTNPHLGVSKKEMNLLLSSQTSTGSDSVWSSLCTSWREGGKLLAGCRCYGNWQRQKATKMKE